MPLLKSVRLIFMLTRDLPRSFWRMLWFLMQRTIIAVTAKANVSSAEVTETAITVVKRPFFNPSSEIETSKWFNLIAVVDPFPTSNGWSDHINPHSWARAPTF